MLVFDYEIMDPRDIAFYYGRSVGDLVRVENRKTGEIWRISGSIGESHKGL